MACNSILRLAAALENGPVANWFDCPNKGEVSVPMGVLGSPC